MGYIFGIWRAIAILSGVAALIGHAVFSQVSTEGIAAITAIAAGAILAMLTDTMIPEAVEKAHNLQGSLLSSVSWLLLC